MVKTINDKFVNTEDANAVMASMLKGYKVANLHFAEAEMLAA
jgi:hypothetical protein